MFGTIKVVNKYQHTPTNDDVYIGRGGPLGNPFTSIQGRRTKAQFVVGSRTESINSFEKWIRSGQAPERTMEALRDVYRRVRDGRDVNLVCFCSPKPCHGDVIKSFIEGYLYSWEP